MLSLKIESMERIWTEAQVGNEHSVGYRMYSSIDRESL
jgi:hypothetical protein